MATTVATLKALLTLDDSQFKTGLKNAETSVTDTSSKVGAFNQRLGEVGGNLQRMGAKITMITAPLGVAFAYSARSALAFDNAMSNVGAVLGKTRDEMKPLNAEILKMGGNSLAGPQKTAEAFYDIVGGVADASTHMDILQAAIATSTAGASDLGATTSALIAVMNSYKFGAEEAAYASDVLTRTVGMGVGSMDEFAGALPSVTGLANSLGISFGDLGAMTAYLTTQGNSASQATTQLGAMMTSLLNPNETMKKGLAELGFTSGEAAIKQLGLAGAMDALSETSTAQTDGMAKMTGSVDALRGVTALADDAFGTFANNFTEGITGATAAAEAIQMEDPANQLKLLQNKGEELAISIGQALIPSLLGIADKIKPVIEQVVAWIGENPELMQGIVLIGGALLVLGPVVGIVGTAFTVVSTVVGGIGAVMMSAVGPILLVATAIGGVIASLNHFNNTIDEARSKANEVIAPKVASGAVSEAEVFDATFKATAGQFGGGFAGDAIARIASPFIFNSAVGRDTGGAVQAGGVYRVGEQGPETIYMAGNGTVQPTKQGGGGGMTIQSVVIHASGQAEGRAAGDAFNARLTELMMASGSLA